MVRIEREKDGQRETETERERERERESQVAYNLLSLCHCCFSTFLTLDHFCRNFYLTQFDESENLDKTGILEMDLSRLSPLDPDRDSLASLPVKKSECS